ncbi:hypothetical protein [Phormidium sp. CCY1219]|uniref:hypothetical protein n=1 Tax=Phormidium sp. CCY1219 TaxID=2886104 RepID=UPI002D1EDAFF|nr:hypothetical protein [Phormidium sp. CCY1219]MEB3826135.1 hypothetical protein [Phormidium sp. CCY1219]
MLFNSLEFILGFLPIALISFYQIGRRGYYNWAIVALLAASFFFYGWWNPPYLLLLIGSIGFNYAIGWGLSHKINRPIGKKVLLIVGIAANLAIIGYYKYANFFIASVDDVLGTSWEPSRQVILPLGISFFTFQQIAYLVDVYRGETQEYSALKYGVFVSFFPQLIAGPIVHHKQMIFQLYDRAIYRFNWEKFTIGITIFIAGLFKSDVC